MEGDNGSEYYRLLQRWLKERQSGGSGGQATSNNGGFKITKQVKMSKKDTKPWKDSGLDSLRSSDSQNSLALVPEQVETLNVQEPAVSREDVQDGISYMNDLKKLNDLYLDKNRSNVSCVEIIYFSLPHNMNIYSYHSLSINLEIYSLMIMIVFIYKKVLQIIV